MFLVSICGTTMKLINHLNSIVLLRFWHVYLFLVFCNTAQANLAPGIQSEPSLEIHVQLGKKIDVGMTDDGHRYIVPIIGGTFTGENIKGTVISGGADWQLDRQDKVKNIKALYALETHDGLTIIVDNQGMVHYQEGRRYAITRPVFHAPQGKYQWLNEAFFVGTIESIKSPRSVVIRAFRITSDSTQSQ